MQAAIHLAPDQFLPHYALAVVLHRRRLLREARAAIGEAIRIDPYSSSAFATLASIEVTAKRWSEAVAAAEKGLEHDPDDRECTNMRAIALVKLGRQGEAAAAIEAALARDPDDAVTHANLGWALLHEGEAKQALGHFREALRLEPELEWARAGIVEALKARNFLYRWMLKWFLWMSRFNTSVQIALVLGILVGQQLLVRVINAVPVLEPLFWPIVILYLGFAWLTWCAPALFNLLLRLDQFGRYALSSEQKMASNFVGFSLLIALLLVIADAARGLPGSWLFAIPFVLLVIPIAATFNCHGGPRWLMAAVTVGIALVAFYAVLLSFTGDNEAAVAKLITACRLTLYSTWAAVLLVGMNRKA